MSVTAEDFAKWIKDADYAFPCDIADFLDWSLHVLRRDGQCGPIWLIEITHLGPRGQRGPTPGAPCKMYWLHPGVLQVITFDNGSEVVLSEADGAALSRAARSWADAVVERHMRLSRHHAEWARAQPRPGEKSLAQLGREDEERRKRAERDYHLRRHYAHLGDVQRTGEAGYLNRYPIF